MALIVVFFLLAFASVRAHDEYSNAYSFSYNSFSFSTTSAHIEMCQVVKYCGA